MESERTNAAAAAAASDPAGQSVRAVADLHARELQAIGSHQRMLETLTASLGQPRTLYALLVVVTLWILSNALGALLGMPHLDAPPFFWLQGAVSLSALLVTTLVLITQNRLGKMAERRTLLDLHVNLLVEQKVAKLIDLIEELRRDLPNVGNRPDLQAEAMTRPIDPQLVVSTLKQSIENAMEQEVGQALEQEVEQALEHEVEKAIQQTRDAGT